MCLQTRYYPQSHTAEHLKEMLLESFNEWKINNKDITGVVDNARNMVKAWQLMDKQYILCFGHTLNLAVKRGLSIASIKDVVGRCR